MYPLNGRTCTCGNPASRGAYCQECFAARKKEKQHRYYVTWKEKALAYEKQRNEMHKKSLALHLRPCQESVDQLNKQFPWLAVADVGWEEDAQGR